MAVRGDRQAVFRCVRLAKSVAVRIGLCNGPDVLITRVAGRQDRWPSGAAAPGSPCLFSLSLSRWALKSLPGEQKTQGDWGTD